MEIKPLTNNKYYNLQLKFVYNAAIVARCNKISKALTWQKFRYDGNLKAWLFNIEDLTSILKEFPGTDVPEEIYDRYMSLQKKEADEVQRVQTVKTEPLETALPLYHYQKIGANFIVQNHKCALLDEVRLGKLYQTVAAIDYLKVQNVLVISPNTPKINWQRKTKELIDRDSTIVKDQFVEGMNIIHFEGLQKFATKEIVIKTGKKKPVVKWTWNDRTEWDMVVVDESHKIKSGKNSIRGTLVTQVCKFAKRVVLLTATPMPTHVRDWIPQLSAIDKLDEFGGEWKFLLHHCNAKKTRFGWDTSGSAHLDELNEKLQKFTLRRLRSEVWKDMPAMTEDVTYVELPEYGKYQEAVNRLNRELSEASQYYRETYRRLAGKNKLERAEVLLTLKEDPKWQSLTSLAIVKIEKLKQEVVRQKLLVLPEILDEYLESKTKVVVFGIHKHTLNELYAQFKDNSVLITGDVAVEEREEERLRFMNNPDKCFAFTTMLVSAEGMDFSAANHVIHTELDWTPDNHTQASGRILNPAKNAPTNSRYIVANKTIEDDIIKVLLDKSGNIDKTIGGTTLTKVLNNIMQQE